MSFLIRILLDYLTLSFKIIFQIQFFESYCLAWKGDRELGIKSDQCRTYNSRDWQIKLIFIRDVIPQGRYSNPRYSDLYDKMLIPHLRSLVLLTQHHCRMVILRFYCGSPQLLQTKCLQFVNNSPANQAKLHRLRS